MATNRNIIVAYDFTSAAESAMNYAIELAKTFEAEVNLLHIAKDSGEVSKAQAKFEVLLKGLNTTIKINTIVKKGNIFTDIGTTGKELHAFLIVMGTHGVKGMQKVFGSFAIKVITSAHIPFIIVQDKNTIKTLDKMVIPIDTSKESLQIEQVVTALANKVNSHIHVIAEKYTDSTLKIKMAVHFEVIRKQFADNNLGHENAYLKKYSSEEILKYAKNVGANMIAISYFSDSIFPQFDRIFQDIITNKDKIPVLIVHAKEAGKFFF